MSLIWQVPVLNGTEWEGH